MQEVFLGDAIRKRRLELKLTQEELCEGICEPVTLSRLENGKQTPSRNTVIALLERLGMPDDRYFALVTKREFDVEVMMKRLRNATIKFERADETEKIEAWKNVSAYIDEVAEMLDKKDKVSYQVLFHMSLIGRLKLEKVREDTFRELLLEAIRVTVPRFEVELINKFRYTSEEMQILCMLANTYRKSDFEKALNIYAGLYNYAKWNSKEISKYSSIMSMILHNYALNLFKIKDYTRSLTILEEGIKLAKETGEYQFLPGYNAMMAENYFEMNNYKESKKWYRRAFYLYEAYGDESNLHMLKKEIEERFMPEMKDLMN